MDVSIAAYRHRIGTFRVLMNLVKRGKYSRYQTYKSKTRNVFTLRKFLVSLLLIISCISKTQPQLVDVPQSNIKLNSPGSLASAGTPVAFLIFGGHNSVSFHPAFHLSFYDILAVHSAATVQHPRAGHLGQHHQGWVMLFPPCKFSTLSDSNFYARYTYGNRNNRGLKLSHWNAGSAFLHNKRDEIEALVADHHPHLLGISESNLHKDHSLGSCMIDEYDLFTCLTMNNVSLQTSRVVVYKHSSVVAKLREDLMSEKFSSIWLEVGFPGRTKILVCNLYRDWQYLGQVDHSSLEITEQIARWNIFLDQWEVALNTGMECVVMGDFNLDYLSFYRTDLSSSSQAYRLKPLVDELLARVGPHGVKQCVVGPTRQGRAGQADTGLDHLWTNIPGKMSQIYTKYNGSDHKVIMGVRYAKILKNNTRYVRKRSYKEFNPKLFLENIRNLSWWDLYQSTDVNIAVELFTEKINGILDKMAPIRTFQTSTRYCPWLSEEAKRYMRERNNSQELFSKNKTSENLKNYKKCRNRATKQLKKDKTEWQRKKLKTCNDDPGKLWKNIMGWLSWCSSGSPSKLYYAGQIVTAPTKLAEIMNNYFVDKVTSIRSNLPRQTDDPLKTVRNIMAGQTPVFSLTCVHPETVKKIILGLKNSKASGVDNIDTFIIKLMVNDILPAVTHIVNLSIQQAAFPSLYKKAKVIPLLKKDDPLTPKNYRPVAILCIVSKVIERCIFQQVLDYMTSNNLFHPNHHGFRAHHSTATAMIQMYDTWVQAVDKGQLTGVCMLDMSAAFDVVDHDILLSKLKIYGFDTNALDWMKDYLSGRSQAVYIDGCLSKFLPVDVGVPQGSILGPLCYILFTNDLPEVILQSSSHVHWSSLTTHCDECGGLCCFADDSTYSVASDNQDILEEKLNQKYKILAEYMANNKLKLNDDKTHLLIMTTNQKHRFIDIRVKIRTPTEEINPKTSEKLLGIIVQDNLKWTDYIQNNEKSLLKQLNNRLNALKLIGNVADFKTRLMVANGIFCSKLIFQIGLWGGTEEYLLNSLQTVQNKAARFVARRGIYTPVTELLRNCGWLSVRQLVMYHSILIIYKTVQAACPKYLHNKLSYEFPYNTRLAQSDSIRRGSAFQCKLGITERSFMNRATVSFNQLPTEIRQCSKLEGFKKKLKVWVMDNCRI